MEAISVCYLARQVEGYQFFERFAASYRAHPAGIPHELVVIAKGFKNEGQRTVLQQIFEDIPHRVISVPDEIGFDLQAYQEAALKTQCDYLCFLNTFTTLRADDWLQKLFQNITQPDVGMVGATGSYESLINSFKVVHQVAWFAQKLTAMDSNLTKRFAWVFRDHSPITAAALKSARLRIRRQIGDVVRSRPKASLIASNFKYHWSAMLQPGGTLDKIRDFAPFPNPHIRTNVFMIRRDDFLSIPLVGREKLDCCRFESGPRGLSTSFRKQGQRLLVVGADGKGYDVHDWPSAGAFRSRHQLNLLAHDNQSREFEGYSVEEQDVIRDMTWGGLDRPSEPELEIVGVHFSKKHDVATVGLPLPRSSNNRLCSIVIPCLNRNKLVSEAVWTALKQNYPNLEICVFDNASSIPLAGTLNHSDIRVERSNEILPVTESWNRALDMARGEYVTLIGDDDGLLPHFFERINTLADAFDNPDVIFSSLVQFVHPGVSPINKDGFVATLPMADFLDEEPGPFVLSHERSRQAVDNSLNLQRSFYFNMPAFTCRKSFLDTIRRDGKILQSPFPDYYFANIVLELSSKTVCEPRPLAFQGVSKASFGFTLLNNITDVGFKALGTPDIDRLSNAGSYFLPGSRYWTEYILTMECVASVLNDPERRPNIQRYRRHMTMELMKSSQKTLGSELWKRLSSIEKAWVIKAAIIRRMTAYSPYARSLWTQIDRNTAPYKYEGGQQLLCSGDFVTGIDVYDAFDRAHFA